MGQGLLPATLSALMGVLGANLETEFPGCWPVSSPVRNGIRVVLRQQQWEPMEPVYVCLSVLNRQTE